MRVTVRNVSREPVSVSPSDQTDGPHQLQPNDTFTGEFNDAAIAEMKKQPSRYKITQAPPKP